MKKEDKKPYILTAIIIILVSMACIYIYLNKLELEFDWKKFALYSSQAFLITSAVGVLLYFFINREIKKMENPKEIVPKPRVWEIWCSEFAKYNKNALVEQLNWYNKKELLPLNREIEILDCKTFPDPHSNTSDLFVRMDVKVKEGLRTGILVTEFLVDLGEQWIREHWNDNIIWKQTITNYKRDLKVEPLTSPQTAVERILDKKLELREEGFSEEEINQLTEPYLQANKFKEKSHDEDDEPIKTPKLKKKKKTIEEEEDESLEDDLNSFREKNK